MIKRYTIESTSWTPITTAGQSGSCWVDKVIRGGGYVLVNHSDSGAPKSYGFRLHNKKGNDGLCLFSADNEDDIYYARVLKGGQAVRILVDAA